MRLFVYTSRLLSWLYSLYCLSYHVVKGVIANIPGTEIRIAGETALVKRVVFFFFLQDIYYMSFLTTQSHILLMQKLFPIPTSDNQDICFGTPKIVGAARGKKGYHFCWDEFSKLLEKRNPHQKSCFTDDHWHQKAIKWLKVAKATCIEPPSNFKQDAFWWFIFARVFHLFLYGYTFVY